MSECIPKKKLPSKKNLPWISNDLLRAMKLRNKLFKAYKRTGNHYKLSQYKLARNCITKEVRRDFLKALTPPIQKPTGNCSRHLSRKVIHSYASCSWLQLVTDNKEKANILNPVSASNFNQSYSTLNPDQTDYSIPPRAEFPEALLCTEEQVFQLISSLNISKSMVALSPGRFFANITAGACRYISEKSVWGQG